MKFSDVMLIPVFAGEEELCAMKFKHSISDEVCDIIKKPRVKFGGAYMYNQGTLLYGDSHTVKWDGVVCRSPVLEHDSFVENQIEYVKILDSKNCCDCSVVCADTFDTAKKLGIEEE